MTPSGKKWSQIILNLNGSTTNPPSHHPKIRLLSPSHRRYPDPLVKQRHQHIDIKQRSQLNTLLIHNRPHMLQRHHLAPLRQHRHPIAHLHPCRPTLSITTNYPRHPPPNTIHMNTCIGHLIPYPPVPPSIPKRPSKNTPIHKNPKILPITNDSNNPTHKSKPATPTGLQCKSSQS